MQKVFLTILLAFILASLLPNKSLGSYIEAPIRQVKDYSITELFAYYAELYSVSEHDMLVVARCESNLNPLATNHTSREFSVGISQINLLAHKNITEAQARDPQFAIEFMAKEFSKGNQHIWTCSRLI